MTVTTSNVIVGTAQLYVAPWGVTTPGEGEPAPDDEDIAAGEAWGGLWVAQGATAEGVKFTWTPKTTDINIEEQPTPVDVTVDTADLSIGTSLAEDTLDNMLSAYGMGSIATQAATGDVIGKKTLSFAAVLNAMSVGFEAVNPAGFWRRVIIPKVISSATVDTSYRRAAAARLYPTTFRSICDLSDISITDQTAVVTS